MGINDFIQSFLFSNIVLLCQWNYCVNAFKCYIDELSMKDSIWPMMILRNNQGDCLRVGLSKQSWNEAKRNGLDCVVKTGTVDCSKSIISLDFFEYFLCQDKKYCRFGVATPRKLIYSLLSLFIGVNANLMKHKQQRVKSEGGSEASEGCQPKRRVILILIGF